MSTTVLTYLAGPMSGYPEHNFPAFQRYAAMLRAQGINIVSPAEVNPAPEVARGMPWSYYMRRDICAMMECGEIILMPRWKHSKGARLEFQLAESLNMRIRYIDADDNLQDYQL